jgi:hypothetical protein
MSRIGRYLYALKPDGQDFPHRTELQTVLEQTRGYRAIDWSEGRRYEVLARVDLGRRITYRALDDAAAMVEVMIGVVINRSNTAAWQRGSLSCLIVDGEVRAVTFGPHGQLPSIEPDHVGQNATADALAKYAPELGELLSAGSLPPSLAEALRLIGEASQVDSRNNTLNRSATIAERTVVVLQATAVEHIASFARISVWAHAEALRSGWPAARWSQQVVEAVERCLHGVEGGADPVFQEVVLFSGNQGRSLSLSAAYRLRDQLVMACPGRLHRAWAARLLDSIGNAPSCAALLNKFESEAVLLDSRLRRIRNALVHGNPVTIEMVKSVREFSRYKVDSALEMAIRSIVHGEPMNELLREQIRVHADDCARINEGLSFYDIWSREY